MGLPRASTAGLCSLAVKVFSIACRCCTVVYGIIGFDLFSCFLQFAYYVVNPPLFNYVYPLPILIWYTYEVYGLPMALGYASASLIISIVILVLAEIIGGGSLRFKP